MNSPTREWSPDFYWPKIVEKGIFRPQLCDELALTREGTQGLPQHSLPVPHHGCLSALLLTQGPAASAVNQINETFS